MIESGVRLRIILSSLFLLRLGMGELCLFSYSFECILGGEVEPMIVSSCYEFEKDAAEPSIAS